MENNSASVKIGLVDYIGTGEEGSDSFVKSSSSATTNMLCGLYALILVVLGLVLPVGVSLTYAPGAETPYETEVFSLYIYTLSLAFLIYLHFYILRLKRRPDQRKSDPEVHAVNMVVSNNKLADSIEDKTVGYGDNIDTSSIDSKDKVHVTAQTSTDVDTEIDDVEEPLTLDATGVNFYLRLGAICFGLGSMVHDGFKIAAVVEWPDDWLDCFGPLPLLNAVLHLSFVFAQTFLIFKSHTISVNIHKAVARFGFMHLVATNLCVWSAVTVMETAEQFREHTQHHQEPSANNVHKRAAEVSNNFTNLFGLNNGTTESGQHSQEDASYSKCYREDSLVHTSAPYLFPCTIEYSLICAAVVYKMFQNVGSSQRRMTVTEQHGGDDQGKKSLQGTGPTTATTTTTPDCHKANTGLFLGLFILVLTMISVSTFFVFTDRKHDYKAAAYLFYITEIFLLGVAAISVVVGFIRFRRLEFTAMEEGWVDVALLVIGLFGTLAHSSFTTVSAVASIDERGTVAILAVASSLLIFVESGMQTAFILDGLRRRADTRDHVHNKPGRTVVTFLLVVNLALWVVMTFEVKKADAIPMHQEYYGLLSWTIISHIFLPLIIFFRFHSSVCLSEMWLHAYHKEKGA